VLFFPLSANDDEAHQRAIALLEANHVFPGEFSLSVIALGDEAITAAIRKAAEDGRAGKLLQDDHKMIPSAQGKYISHRLRVQCQSASDVLDLFARMRAVQGVVTVL
jgi:putative lipoic acid-binding regulatory protein